MGENPTFEIVQQQQNELFDMFHRLEMQMTELLLNRHGETNRTPPHPPPTPPPGNDRDQQPHRRNPNIPVPSILPLSLSGDRRKNFTEFLNQWNDLLIVTGLEHDTERRKIASLRMYLGAEAREYLNNLPLTDEEEASAQETLNALQKHLIPKKIRLYERTVFRMARQESGESADAFVNRLRGLLATCNYGEAADEHLIEQIVVGMADVDLRERFYGDEKLTVEEALNQMKIHETTKQQLQQLTSQTQSVTLHEVNAMDGRTHRTGFRERSQTRRSSSPHRSRDSSRNHDPEEKCYFCGRANHSRKDCPAADATCNYCQIQGHFSIVCRRRMQAVRGRNRTIDQHQNVPSNETRQNVNTVCDVTTYSRDSDYVIQLHHIDSADFVGSMHLSTRMLTMDLLFIIKGQKRIVTCFLDTCSTCNAIGYQEVCELMKDSNPQLNQSSSQIYVFGESSLSPLGQIDLEIVRHGSSHKLPFQVVKHNQPPLLSANTCLLLELIAVQPESFNTDIRRQTICSVNIAGTSENPRHGTPETALAIVKKYDDVFEGIGKLANPVTLEINENIKPIIDVPRRIPIAVRPVFDQTIAELEELGMIEKVAHHTDWVSNSLLVHRNGKHRLCIDPTYLNTALKRVNYQMPTIEEILPELANAKIFTTLDAKKGFWQLALDPKSCDLTTFWGPSGRYRWLRLPFGVSPAPELFQQRLHSIVHGLKGVEVVADDILLFGCGDTEKQALQDHNQNLEQLLQRLREANLKLNREKMELCKDTVKFYGHVLTNNGIKPDSSKVTAIVGMPAPTDVLAVQRFLGMVTYLNRYIPNLSSHTSILRKLTHEGAVFQWTKEEQECFDNLKHLLSTAPVLAYFDVTKPTVIECDASSTGLGSVLLQEDRPIAYASRALTTTEQNYAQIEKETLAIVFSCVHFNQYITAKPITVKSDHQPLETIFRRPLCKAPKRIQRMLMQLQNYNLDVKYVKGKSLHLADALSRAYINMDAHPEEKIIENVNALLFLRVSDDRVKDIAEETARDPEMRELAAVIQTGWPKTSGDLQRHIQPFFSHRHELTTHNGLIFKGQRIVVPPKLRSDIIRRLHESHSGMENTLQHAREVVFWPGITDHIRNKIANCQICIVNSNSNRKEPMQSVQPPDLQYQYVSMDLMEVIDENQIRRHYLVSVDHYSDFFTLDYLEDQKSSTVIKKCKKNFSNHGIPEIVICDNGVQFLADEFRSFAAEWEFKISTCSPYHKEGNGKAESAVKIAKSLIKKSIESRTDIELALLIWRNTPNKMGTSPAQRLYSRRTRCPIPCAPELLLPKIVEGVKEKIIENKQRSKGYHDTKTRGESEFQIGEMVFVRLNDQSKKWSPGVVVNQLKPRSYTVEVNNRHYRRNSFHLKPATSHQSYKSLSTSPDTSSVASDSSTKDISRYHSSSPSGISTQQHFGDTIDTANNNTITANDTFGRPSSTSTPRMTGSSQEVYLTPSQSPSQPTIPIIGRQKRNIKMPVRFADYDLDDNSITT
jgi:RNase H-like domain found in reverse transcriptase/Reverse transcriptase (RNA-dependent DNA polymerase)/Integrase zinc binding domain/Integrase core domain